MKEAAASSGSRYCRWALYVPILLFAAGVPGSFGQCSQATRAEAASSAEAAEAAQSRPPGEPATASSSSSDTAGAVRFVTDSAVTVLENTPLQVINDMAISSRTTKAGARLAFTLTRDVVVDGVLVIPCGAMVYGTVVEAKQAGRLMGSSNLTLQLTDLNLDGRSYPLYTPPFKVVATSKTSPTVKKISIGAAAGALAAEASMPAPRTYDVIDGPQHTFQETQRITARQRAEADAVVAGVGAGIGTAIAASSPASIALIPAESQLEFTLASPIAVVPVDQRTAARLARGMHHGGPVLYVRGESQ